MPDDLTRLLCDPARLGPWLDAQDLEVGLEGGRPLTVERITTGHSNETFFVRRGGSAWILRRPPRVPLAPTAHDMVREARLLRALTATVVPVPHLVAASADPNLIGAPFHLTERLDGLVIRDRVPERLLADLGLATALWPDPDEERLPLGEGLGLAALGLGSRHDLARRYAERTGRSIADLPYYQALGLFRLACILEGSWARHVRGAADDPAFAALGAGVPAMARRARRLCGA